MAVASSSASKQKLPGQNGKIRNRDDESRKDFDSGGSSLAKRTKSSDVRLVGDPTSNSWKTCHQCRQRTMVFVDACKSQKDKLCTIKFCHRCLLNRYGESAEEVAVLEEWNCPKCRGICNCSVCMKKRGHRPTGILVHTAKKTGFSSVSELLHVKGPENVGIDNIVRGKDIGSAKVAASNNEPAVASPRKRGKENSFSGNRDSNLHSLPLPSNFDEIKQKNRKQEGLKEMQRSNHGDGVLLMESSPTRIRISCESLKGTQNGECDDDLLLETSPSKHQIAKKRLKKEVKSNALSKKKANSSREKKDKEADIPMPHSTELTNVASIDLPPEDVGHALQFLEFCSAFAEILDLKEDEPEYVLQELMRGGRGCRGRYSPVVQFHVRLLSPIQKDLGESSPVTTSQNGKNSWLRALRHCASRSQSVLERLKLEKFCREADDYDSLDSSEKLRFLNFLCDQFLCTAKIRSWIDDQNSKFVAKVKEAEKRLLAAKHKEKLLKQKMQDEMPKAGVAKDGAVSLSEHEASVSQIKTDIVQAHAEFLELKGMLPKEKQRSNAVRTEPIISDFNGRTYWRLQSYSDESNILLQDVGTWDAVELGEKWFIYDVEQQKEVEKYICSLRKRRLRSESIDGFSSSSSDEADLKPGSRSNLAPPVSEIKS